MLRETLPVLLVLVACQVSRAQTVDYFQNFPGTASSGSVSLGSYNWSGYYGNSSTNVTQVVAGMGGSIPNGQVSNGTGATSTMNNVNATVPAGSSNAEGVAFITAPNNTYSYLMLTGEYTIATNSGTTEPGDFTWLGAGNIADTQRLAIEIDSQWYVSSTILTISKANTTSAGSVAANDQQDFTTFSTAASGWYLLNFATSGSSTLSVGAQPAGALPTDNITTFGVYMTGGTTSADKDFIDNFEVDSPSSPEPSMALLLGASLPLLRWRRR